MILNAFSFPLVSRYASVFPVLALVLAVLLPITPAQGDTLKIAYVNFVKVIEEAPQAKEALKKLEAEFRPRDKELVDMQAKVKEAGDKLEKDALVMKAAERRQTERELLVLKRNLRRATQEFREDYNIRRNEELAVLQRLVSKVIVEIAKREQYDLVVHEGTLYASQKVDITAKVLAHLANTKK